MFIKGLPKIAPPLLLSTLWWMISYTTIIVSLAFNIDNSERWFPSWGPSQCSQPMRLLKYMAILEFHCESPVSTGIAS